MSTLTISQWAEEDRPRERLLAHGASALTNAELLAILIGSGTPQVSAVDLMKQVLGDCGNNLNALGKLSFRQLTAYKGIGEAKAVTLLAACELGKRRQMEQALERPELSSAQAIYDYMRPRMQDLDVEEAWVLLMNHNFRHIATLNIARGGITEAAVDVRLILREALVAGATVVALCHNHPSGNAKPSRADDRLTESVKTACQAVRIHLADHVIVTDGQYYSYAEHGKI